MKILLLLFAVSLALKEIPNLDSKKKQWEDFKRTYGKVYKNKAEDKIRMKIYMETLDEITKHNKLYEAGLSSYKIGINQFADMTQDDIGRTMRCHNHTLIRQKFENISTSYIAVATVKIPDHVDWRKKGAVTAVKDQGHCAGCWAFGAVAVLESQQFRKTNKLVRLSEQNLIDCSLGNYGCKGGKRVVAFRYVSENGGLDTEEFYPYEGKEGRCRYNPKYSGVNVYNYVIIRSGDENQLKNAVATVGPISISLYANKRFDRYTEGILNEPKCNQWSNHVGLIVGYGTENGHDYWIVKNSWGADWGDKGYIKMSRNKKNQCGIATEALYPLV